MIVAVIIILLAIFILSIILENTTIGRKLSNKMVEFFNQR